MIRVLIVHHSPVYRRGLQALVERCPDMHLVSLPTDEQQVFTTTQDHHPDVILLDGDFQDAIFDLVSQIRLAGGRGICIFAPAGRESDEEYLFEFLKNGAAAYESPAIAEEQLVEKIRRLADGEFLISAASLFSTVFAPPPLQQAPEQEVEVDAQKQPVPERLPIAARTITPREITLLKLIAQGNSNKEIARVMGISDQTVKNHVTSVFRKFQIVDRTSAVVIALRTGLITLDDTIVQGQEYELALAANA